MHILVIGGTGASGLEFIERALETEHTLTLYARNPSKFPPHVSEHVGVKIVKGEFDDMDAVKQALALGAEILVSFAGPNLPAQGMAVSEFYQRLFPLLPSESSINRCLILSTASYKAPEDKPSIKWTLGIWSIWLLGGTAYAEINGMSRAVASLRLEEVEWTLFRVPRLHNGQNMLVRAGFIGDSTDGLFLSRRSLAIWILQELQEKKWVGKSPALSNPGWL